MSNPQNLLDKWLNFVILFWKFEFSCFRAKRALFTFTPYFPLANYLKRYWSIVSLCVLFTNDAQGQFVTV